MGENKCQKVSKKKIIEEQENEGVNDAEYRLKELVYILHQADIRCIRDLLKKRKKVKVPCEG